MKYDISEECISQLQDLMRENYEHSGKIIFKKDGSFDHIVFKKSQKMNFCDGECVANFHTHPVNYTEFYPDHPSAKDIHYLLGSINHTTKTHLIITPKFMYVCYLQKPIFLPFLQQRRIYSDFDILSKKYDRSTEIFRKEWLKAINRTGLTVVQKNYESFYIETQTNYIPTTMKIMLIIFLLIFLVKI